MSDIETRRSRNPSLDSAPTSYLATLTFAFKVSGIFFLAALTGIFFTFDHLAFNLFWPANGFLLAMLLIGRTGQRAPTLFFAFLACVAANLIAGRPLLPSIGMSAANILEVAAAEALLRRFAGGSKFLDDMRHTGLFFGVVTFGGTIVGALIGGLTVVAFLGQGFLESFRTWWLVDAAGIAIITPAIISWREERSTSFGGMGRRIELVVCLLVLTLLSYIVLSESPIPWDLLGNPRPSYLFPFLLWAALRFGVRGASAALMLVYVLAAWFTGHGRGPFIVPHGSSIGTLISMHFFLYAAAFCTVLPAVLFNSRMRAEAELKKWESRYQHLWKNRLVGVYISDINGVVSDANDAFLAMVGYTRVELESGLMRLRDIATPEYIAQAESRVERFRKAGYLVPYEREWALRDGRSILTVMFASQLEDGKSILCMVMDVTELKKTQADLRRRQSRYDSLLASNLAGIYVCDSKGLVKEANDTFLSLVGYSRQELEAGKIEVIKMATPEHIANFKFLVERFQRDGKMGPYEREWVLRDGRRFLSLMFAIKLDEPDLALCMILDITELKRTKQELRRTENLYKSLVDSNVIGVAIVGKEGVFQEANETYLNITGYSRKNLLDGTFNVELLKTPLANEEGLYAKVSEEISKSGKTEPAETPYLRKDGAIAYVYRGVVRLEESDRYLVVAMDMSHMKKMQSQLEAAKQAAESANQAKSKFLAHMSHEIRTPLNGILGMHSLLMDSALTEQQSKFARAAQRCGEHLLSLVNQVLDLSKIENEKLELERVPFKLEKILEGSMLPVTEKAGRKAVKIVTDIRSDVPAQFIGDPFRLQQVLVNLLDNAVKFSSQGEILLSVRNVGRLGGKDRIEFEVLDKGIGMPKETVDMLFRPFQQGDSSMARKAGGTGLGLAICRGLVELMGGTIDVNSKSGIGSSFQFTVDFLPYSGPVEEIQSDLRISPSEISDPNGSRRPLEILVVDDNPTNLEVTAAMLARLGCKVVPVEDGEAAISMMAKNKFGLILMDLEMPGIDGFELFSRIRSSESETFPTPVLAVTANAVAGVKEHCLSLGMDGYISKPFSFHSLHQALSPWLTSGASAPSAVQPTEHAADNSSIDWRRLNSLVHGNSNGLSSMQNLIQIFFTSTRAELTSLRELTAKGEALRIKNLLHKLRGGCAMVGAIKMAALALVMEKQIETSVPSDSVDMQLENLEIEFENVLAQLHERLL